MASSEIKAPAMASYYDSIEKPSGEASAVISASIAKTYEEKMAIAKAKAEAEIVNNYWKAFDTKFDHPQLSFELQPNPDRPDPVRKFETDLLGTFLLGMQRLSKETGVPELDTKFIEEMLCKEQRQTFHEEFNKVLVKREEAIYYSANCLGLEGEGVVLDHNPCSICEALEIEIARDYLRLSTKDWFDKMSKTYRIRLDDDDDLLHSVYRKIKCSSGMFCIRFDYEHIL